MRWVGGGVDFFWGWVGTAGLLRLRSGQSLRCFRSLLRANFGRDDKIFFCWRLIAALPRFPHLKIEMWGTRATA
jgi:hypothetical protein